jgi:cytoskeleton protein RodZ
MAAIAPAEAAPQTPAAAAPAQLQLRALRDSWIEVVDAHGQALLSRTLKGGESVGLDGDPPLRLRIGNVAGTEISFRGRPVELGPYNRNNLARFELK